MFLKIIKLKYFLFLFILLPSVCLATTSSFFPDFPMAFWGDATLNGNDLPAETKIQAYCDNELIGEVTMIEDGIYGYNLATKNKLLVSNCNSKIVFKYLLKGNEEALAGDEEISYVNGFEAGKVIEKDLHFINSIAVTEEQSDNESGGGTGSSFSNVTLTEDTTKTGDIDGNNKVDILDFNLLMINWGNNPQNEAADIDGNGKVDIFDFNLLMVNWDN